MNTNIFPISVLNDTSKSRGAGKLRVSQEDEDQNMRRFQFLKDKSKLAKQSEASKVQPQKAFHVVCPAECGSLCINVCMCVPCLCTGRAEVMGISLCEFACTCLVISMS